jgi:FkbM family methyltransferase
VLISFNDFIQERSYKSIKILDKEIKFFVPNQVTNWRVDTYFSKEPETLEWIDSFEKKENLIFWDIGANIGLYSIYNSLKNPKSTTIAFEPSSSNLRVLTRNISINNLEKNIKVVPITLTNKENIFEEALTLATRMCDIVKEQLVITTEVKLLYESENRNAAIDNKMIKILKPNEEKFLTQLIDFVEQVWNKPNFHVNDFSNALGFSKSQLYRKLTKLTGQSPNKFLKEFRLHKALELLHKQNGNISEIAFETGFNSAAYFSKCFLDKYGILPSKYIQQHIL